MSDHKFRVIIVGAGPVGLYMAHAMERANIDFVILEQQPTVLNFSGQLIFTWPQTVRLFDQIGIYKDVEEAAFEIHQKKRVYGDDGHVTSTSRFWDFMQDKLTDETAMDTRFCLCCEAISSRTLYMNLRGKDTNIRTSAEVVDIKTHADGVSVHLKDGSVVEGSIVMGADGVHSTTRKLMQVSSKESALADAFEDPMVSTFYGIFGRASNEELGIEPEIFFESRGAGAVVQCLGSKKTLQFVTLKPLPEPMTGRKRYSKADMEEYATSIADVAVCPGVKFRDVWAKADKASSRMLNQEEGLSSRWHEGRIVLLGDAAHKTTSVNGLGMTCGMHSAALLANELQSLVATHPNPSTALIEGVFTRYQQDRQDEVKAIWDRGHTMIREVTQRSWVSWFWDEYVLPWFDTESLARGLMVSHLLIKHGQTLSYVPFVGEHGKVPWLRRPAAQA